MQATPLQQLIEVFMLMFCSIIMGWQLRITFAEKRRRKRQSNYNFIIQERDKGEDNVKSFTKAFDARRASRGRNIGQSDI